MLHQVDAQSFVIVQHTIHVQCGSEKAVSPHADFCAIEINAQWLFGHKVDGAARRLVKQSAVRAQLAAALDDRTLHQA